MAKYLKKFQDNAQYEAYTASTVFITPNVSYCVQDSDVHYTSTPPVVHVDSVSVSPATVTLNVDDTTALTATVLPADATDKSVTWSSSDSNVATVDSSGVVTAIAAGNATITVTTVDGGLTAQCAATVAAQPTIWLTYSASSKLNVDLTKFTPAATVETYDSTTQTGQIGFTSNVTAIGDKAFSGKTALTSVEIPNTVTSVGHDAFTNCTNLTSIAIPDSVTTVGSYSLVSCGNLLTATIGSGVTRINDKVFNFCYKLQSITINATTPPRLGGRVFDDSNNCPIYVPSASVNAYKTASGWSTYASRIQPKP